MWSTPTPTDDRIEPVKGAPTTLQEQADLMAAYHERRRAKVDAVQALPPGRYQLAGALRDSDDVVIWQRALWIDVLEHEDATDLIEAVDRSEGAMAALRRLASEEQ